MVFAQRKPIRISILKVVYLVLIQIVSIVFHTASKIDAFNAKVVF